MTAGPVRASYPGRGVNNVSRSAASPAKKERIGPLPVITTSRGDSGTRR